ncbi:nuclease-related domain-containing protein [Spirillospora sp. NPDC048824]|uniref:nuclease-related domain-containing protein n=1 Tax=Spirillospora sp. NPDC048824 TaxID=3364526 RepID=UPI00371421CF
MWVRPIRWPIPPRIAAAVLGDRPTGAGPPGGDTTRPVFSVAVRAFWERLNELRPRSWPGPAAWDRGDRARRRTERTLFSLQKDGFVSLHGRTVSFADDENYPSPIDHLVIGPTGVFIIYSEEWDKRLPVRALSPPLRLLHGPFDKRARLDEAQQAADAASQLLSAATDLEVRVTPALAIFGPTVPFKVLTMRGVDIYSGTRVRYYLRSRKAQGLTGVEIESILQAARTAFPASTR